MTPSQTIGLVAACLTRFQVARFSIEPVPTQSGLRVAKCRRAGVDFNVFFGLDEDLTPREIGMRIRGEYGAAVSELDKT